jgi:hypothetical protein
MLTAATAWGGIVYSGPKNIVIQGLTSGPVITSINLAGGSGTWDRITFHVNGSAPPTYCKASVRVGADSEVGLTTGASLAVVTRFSQGASFPTPPLFLTDACGYLSPYFSHQNLSDEARDEDFYVAMVLGHFGNATGPSYSGWMHVRVEGSATTTPRITVVDWAYSDQVSQKPSMGQTSGIPPTAPMGCSVGRYGSVSTIARVNGLTERVGDFILDCVGGTPTPAGQVVPSADFTFSVSSALSNFVTSLGSTGTPKFTSNPTNGLFSEALLLVDEPNNFVRSLGGDHLQRNPVLNCGQTGAPDNGPSGAGVCSILSAGSPLFTYDGTPNGYASIDRICNGFGTNPAANTYGCGRPNVFQGKLSALNGQNTVLRFSGVPLDPPGDAHRIIRLTNVRVNVAGLAVSNGFELTAVLMDVTIQSGGAPIPIAKPTLPVVSYLQIGLQNSGAESVVTSPILAREGFPSAFAFRNISAAAGDNSGVPGNGIIGNVLRYNGGGSSYPADVAQNLPGLNYFSESGFLWQNSGVNGPPAVNPPAGVGSQVQVPLVGNPLISVGYGGTNTGIDKSGRAQAGTRVAIKFTNIPAGAQVELPPTFKLVQSGTTFTTGIAALTTTDANGAGPYTPRSGFFTSQDNLAVYEMLFADPIVQEDLNVPFTLTGAPAGTQLKAIVMFAPFYSTVEFGNPSAALPEPRFADPTQYVSCLTVACVQATPTQGPNTAPINVTISAPPAAQGFAVLAGAQVKLTANGQPDILGTNTSNTPDVWTLKTTFNLTGATAGARDIVITAADGKSFSAGTFTIQAVSCSYNVSPLSASYNSGGGWGQINITASTPGCTWTASTSTSWITLNPKTSTVQPYRVAPNSSSTQRSGSISVAGKTIQITQEGACTYSISEDRQQFSSFGGWAFINVTARSGCNWTVSSDSTWLNIVSNRSGSGNGWVLLSVAPNWGGPRTGRASIAGKTFTATQSGGSWWNWRF